MIAHTPFQWRIDLCCIYLDVDVFDEKMKAAIAAVYAGFVEYVKA